MWIDLNDYNREQREILEEALTGGVPPMYVRVIAQPHRSAQEMKGIIRLIDLGFAQKLPVERFVNPNYSLDKMEKMYDWISGIQDVELAESYADEALTSGKPMSFTYTFNLYIEDIDPTLIKFYIHQYLRGKVTEEQMPVECRALALYKDMCKEQIDALSRGYRGSVPYDTMKLIANPALTAKQMETLVDYASDEKVNQCEAYVDVYERVQRLILENEPPKKISVKDKLDGFISEKPKKTIRYIRDKDEIAKIPRVITYAPKHHSEHTLER